MDVWTMALGGSVLLLSIALIWVWVGAARRVRRAREEGAAGRETEVAGLRAERQADQQRLSESRAELLSTREAERLAAQANAELAAQYARVQTQHAQAEQFARDVQPLRLALDGARAELALANANAAALKAQLDATTALAVERQQALAQIGVQMKAEFETLSQRILDEKTRKFTETNQNQMGSLLTPLREQLDGFKKQVSETWDRETRERVGLKIELEQLRNLNQRLGAEATALTRALKGEQRVQGQWGEMLLSRLLEASGLEPGRGFELQKSVQGDDGRQRPDAIVHLPEERDLVIDAKVSLVAWERWCAADSSESRELQMKAHLGSMRTHITELEQRNYASLPGVRSVDFVLMFVPIEAAFIEASRVDDTLSEFALERNVVIVSTSTLLATLRTVASVWRNEVRNRYAMEIADRAGRLYDRFRIFIEEFDRIGAQLERAQQSFFDARSKLVQGKGNVVSQFETLHKLGARAQKRLDRELRDEAALDDESIGDEAPGSADNADAN